MNIFEKKSEKPLDKGEKKGGEAKKGEEKAEKGEKVEKTAAAEKK